MLSENIKNLRKQKGMTQEELATRLHIVRQTVSKWEKGISVPDAPMLMELANVLDTNVATLLGELVNPENDTMQIAEQLTRISEHLAVRNRRWRIFWKVLGIGIAVILTLNIILALIGICTFQNTVTDTEIVTELVE